MVETKTVLILTTLDTKGTEALNLMEDLSRLGTPSILADLSLGKGESNVRGDISADQLMAMGKNHSPLEEGEAVGLDAGMDVMIAGASHLARELIAEGKIGGLIGIGGYTGTFMITAVMQSLPFGLPKIMVSSAAALPGLSNRFFQISDILLFHSVIEISGRSDLLKGVLQRAAAALNGMLRFPAVEFATEGQKAIAMTMLNICEKCASTVRRALEKQGYQVIGFLAAGIGDQAMEDMIRGGIFSGVVDLAPGGIGEHLFGGMRDAGPHRLEAAGEAGLPQIISTCGVNHMSPSKSRYTTSHHQRARYDLDRFRTMIRMTSVELKMIAQLFADKLNRSKGPAKVMIPLKGWSAMDSPGRPTFNPEEDAVFTGILRKKLRKTIEIVKIDANMEDPLFAKSVIEAAVELFR